MREKNPTYLVFRELPNRPGRKTKLVMVSNKSDIELGFIEFKGAWRQYVFEPSDSTVFDVKCLKEIIEEIEQMNFEIRAEWKNRQKKTDPRPSKNQS